MINKIFFKTMIVLFFKKLSFVRIEMVKTLKGYHLLSPLFKKINQACDSNFVFYCLQKA